MKADLPNPEEYDSCVLRLTRVRAQPQASKSVTRVCVVFHASAHALVLARACKHRVASVLPTLRLFLQERSRRCRLALLETKVPHRLTERMRSSTRIPIHYL